MYTTKLIIISAGNCSYCQSDKFKQLVVELRKCVNLSLVECSSMQWANREFSSRIYEHARYYPKFMMVTSKSWRSETQLNAISVFDMYNTWNFDTVLRWYNAE